MTAAMAEPLLWWQSAACQNIDPELFHPARGESTKAARAVCAICSVRAECLDWALRNHEKFGIWGGTSERERRRIRAGLPPTIEPFGTPRICVCCGDTYRPVRRIQRFCSPDCRSFHTTHCLAGR